MPLLALDTSADIAVAVVDDAGTVLAERRVAEQRRHAELLAPLVVEALAAADVDRRALTGVVAGTGPAPFTGLRAGLVTARSLAFALGVPVHGVCSLDALAVQAYAAGAPADAEVVVVTDARRREVYTARYRLGADDVDVVDPPAVMRPEDLTPRDGTPPAVVVGPGLRVHADRLALTPPDGAPVVDAVDAGVLARLAVVRLGQGRSLPTEPLYLRRPDVMPAAARKRATG
ncbi:tRNA (adenosine(37)-N6)-threonylcarbamoyltransferase complex dimerization subunit type 1 TsaB [Actinotalea ferrariae]|uniref:tRNA (adenosine(37)-N6)-threonylcarbamoyltransferase complex dimerization subunit type 1 TsaB n=1 Tax=Actinotalea ferrariae TaxID=1386098 RepID=UPI001C8B2B17|nr:tRNA (adenosine(37)-N6)-threonylcarbamoyltransferase complex dimerization subunit type 1 TsaB [Actinotalea ferrariae]MBX9246998.1 tRNA (adenosine(37)-N6)-threonylcarbamoyltransferase complex dimerization subunit type 1 TsaB [Actinotalea ferrariae]